MNFCYQSRSCWLMLLAKGPAIKRAGGSEPGWFHWCGHPVPQCCHSGCVNSLPGCGSRRLMFITVSRMCISEYFKLTRFSKKTLRKVPLSCWWYSLPGHSALWYFHLIFTGLMSRLTSYCWDCLPLIALYAYRCIDWRFPKRFSFALSCLP